MKILKREQLEEYLKREIEQIENAKQAVDRFIYFFENYKLNIELDDVEDDMLLFQYGHYDWNGNGEQFEFNLTRQFAIPDEDEFLQLSLTLYYSAASIEKLKSFNSWSVDFDTIEEWKLMIEHSEGFKKTIEQKVNKVMINLSMT
jgi:hypothetical protein